MVLKEVHRGTGVEVPQGVGHRLDKSVDVSLAFFQCFCGLEPVRQDAECSNTTLGVMDDFVSFGDSAGSERRDLRDFFPPNKVEEYLHRVEVDVLDRFEHLVFERLLGALESRDVGCFVSVTSALDEGFGEGVRSLKNLLSFRHRAAFVFW